MKIETKKIIAREFLIFLACLALAILAFLGTFPYNAIYETKMRRMRNSIIPINQEITKFEQPYKEKISRQKWFYNETVKRDINGDFKDYSALWKLLEDYHKADSMIYTWNNVWEKGLKKEIEKIGFKSGEQFDKFIFSNTPNQEETDNESNAQKLRDEVRKLESQINSWKYHILERKEQNDFAIKILLVLTAISFPLRYLFLSIRWSIKTLKQKE